MLYQKRIQNSNGAVSVDCDFDSFFLSLNVSIQRIGKEFKRYQEHERLTKPGKSHPMAEPLQYMKTAFNSFKRKLLKESITLRISYYLLRSQKRNIVSQNHQKKYGKIYKCCLPFEKRLLAIHLLGKYKCTECIDMLVNTMNNDHIFEVQKLAHDKLVRFGLDVGAQPKRPPHHTDPQQKLLH